MEEMTSDSTEMEEQSVQEPVEEIVSTETDAVSDDSLEESIEKLKEGDDVVEGEVAAAAPEYTPNYKFKVMDEEHEIEEIFRPAIVSKESEEKFRELYEKAKGLDHVKEERERFRENFNEHREALEKQTGAINALSGYLDMGDYESFFNALDIPKQEIMKFALQEAQKAEWTPEQRAQHDNSWEAKRRANIYQEQYNTNQTQLESLRQDQVVKDYQLELYRPEVQEFQQSFDQRNGKDAFRNEVANLGTFHEKVNNNVLPVGELVKEVMNKFSPFLQATAQSSPQAPQSQVVQQPKAVPVIPNTGPAGQAPTQKAIKSLDDLQKLANSL